MNTSPTIVVFKDNEDPANIGAQNTVISSCNIKAAD